MSQIINKIRNVNPNDSDAVKDALTTFFQNLSRHTEVDCNTWLRELEDIVTRFPKYCASYRNTIEHYLVRFLSSNNYHNVIEAAKCAHALQQIKPSQDKVASAKNCWREQMSILCEVAHKLIETIFSKTIKIYKNSKKLQKQEAQLLKNSPLIAALYDSLNFTQNDSSSSKKTILCTRLKNVFVFIQAMLVEIYPVGKPIQPQLILEVIMQALSVSSNVNSNPNNVVTVKTEALKTLDAMVACLGSNLIPFSALVFRFVMQTLRWSLDNPSEESRKIRCAAYASLGKWLTTLHTYRSSHTQTRSWEDELNNHIIEDITPPKRVVQLTMNTVPTKNLSKKAKRKLANTMLQQSSIASHMPGEKNKIPASEEVNEELTNAALDCAETYLTVCGIFLKPSTHKVFQERLVRECYNIDSFTSERGIRLLRALDACRKNSASTVPPPTQYCLHLYSTLLNSKHDEITKFCSRALLDIRLHLHCSPPSLNFAIEPQPDKKKADANKNKISEKNRAALESLLGKERVPSKIQQEIMILPDEPLNKRQRLEDIADEISVSSESVDSIEISDDSDLDENAIQEIDAVMESVDSTEIIDDESNTEPEIITKEISIQINYFNKVATTEEDTNMHKAINDSNITTIQNNTEESENTENETVHEQTTDTIDRNINIYDAKTQLPLNTSNDTEEGEKSPVSMEVGYDYPNATNKVKELEIMDDENLPSTNDTDDVQITCGQDIKSQELGIEKNKIEETPTVNGILDGESGEKVESVDVRDGTETNEAKNVKEVTVDDMLADFVDEVNDDNKIEV